MADTHHQEQQRSTRILPKASDLPDFSDSEDLFQIYDVYVKEEIEKDEETDREEVGERFLHPVSPTKAPSSHLKGEHYGDANHTYGDSSRHKDWEDFQHPTLSHEKYQQSNTCSPKFRQGLKRKKPWEDVSDVRSFPDLKEEDQFDSTSLSLYHTDEDPYFYGPPLSVYLERDVSYECSMCNHVYITQSDLNPWWSLKQQECPKCLELQFPRVDIAHPINCVTRHSPLFLYNLATADNDDDSLDDSENESDENSHEASGACSPTDDMESFESLSTPQDEDLDRDQAAKLWILMSHARHCTGKHTSSEHREVCLATKHLMLHLRDCISGKDGPACLHPWCKPCKNLLKHVAKCENSRDCDICTPRNLPRSLRNLRDMNLLIENRNCFPEQRNPPSFIV